MIKKKIPILGHFCPLFVQIAQMGLILPRWGLILPRIPSPTPVLYSALTNTFWGYVHNTPDPTPKHPFPGLKLKVGKWTTVCVKLIPMWQNIWKVGKTFLEVGKKKIFMMSYTHMNKDPQNPIQLLQGYGLERQYLRLSDFLVVLVDEQHSDTV